MSLRVDEACDAAYFGLTVGRATAVDDVDASVSTPGVAGTHIADTLALCSMRVLQHFAAGAKMSKKAGI